mgnify:FL=1
MQQDLESMECYGAILKLNFIGKIDSMVIALKQTPTVNKKNQVRIGYEMEDTDFCNYCNIKLTNHNVCIMNMCSDETDETLLYCKPCLAIFRRDMNLRTGHANGITMCVMCGIPKNECKCNAKKISYNLRKKMK